MATSSKSSQRTIAHILKQGTAEEIIRKIRPMPPFVAPLPPEVPGTRNWSAGASLVRRKFLQERRTVSLTALSGERPFNDDAALRGNIESYIGMTQVPTGVIGPLRINGVHAKGDYYVPLATSEGALVASFHRGAMVCSEAGGVTSVCLTELVQRSPVFQFETFG